MVLQSDLVAIPSTGSRPNPSCMSVFLLASAQTSAFATLSARTRLMGVRRLNLAFMSAIALPPCPASELPQIPLPLRCDKPLAPHWLLDVSTMMSEGTGLSDKIQSLCRIVGPLLTPYPRSLTGSRSGKPLAQAAVLFCSWTKWGLSSEPNWAYSWLCVGLYTNLRRLCYHFRWRS